MYSATEANSPPINHAQTKHGAAGVSLPQRKGATGKLSEAEERKLRELRETDARVRRHEEAHRAAAGSLYRGGPNYTYETGPDGKRYAVAGSVQIDTSPGRTPEETVQKAAQIRRAALAPMDPSGTDRAVASKATRMEDAARRALARKSMSGGEAPRIQTTPTPPLPIRDTPADAKGQAASPQEVDAKAIEPTSTQTLSPGDLGGEVWSVVSDLSDSTQLKQERRSDAMPTPAPHVDVMA